MKLAAIVIGLFIVGLSYLSYRGWIDVRWMEMENTAKTTLTNVAGQVGHVLNSTASQFAAHSTTVEAAGLPVAAAFGFMPGLMLGLKKRIMKREYGELEFMPISTDKTYKSDYGKRHDLNPCNLSDIDNRLCHRHFPHEYT